MQPGSIFIQHFKINIENKVIFMVFNAAFNKISVKYRCCKKTMIIWKNNMYLEIRVKLFHFTYFSPVIYMYLKVKIIRSSISEKLNSTKKRSPTWFTFQLLLFPPSSHIYCRITAL